MDKETIKHCAVELFENKGVLNTSVNDIVKKAGIAKGTFYIYYKNKAELINEVFDRYNELFLKKVVVENSAEPRIKNFSRDILDFYAENRMYLIEFRSNMLNDQNYLYVEKAKKICSNIILSFLNINQKYVIKNMEMYSNILLVLIVELCYKVIVEKSIVDFEEGVIMMEDILERFFKC